MSRLAALPLVGCLVAAALCPFAAGGDEKSKPAPKQRADALGDPLPPAALARLGSLRLVHGNDLSALAVSTDDKILYTVGSRAVRAWDVATGKERSSFTMPEEEQPVALAVSPDARFLACATADAHIAIRDITSGKTVQRVPTGKGVCTQLAFAADGKSLVWVGSEGGVNITDTGEKGKTRELKGTQQNARQLCLSRDGRFIAVLADEERAVVWDAVSGKRLREYSHGTSRRGTTVQLISICIDPDGKALYAGTGEGTVVAWETDSLEQRYALEAVPGGVSAVALSPDGKTLAVSMAAGGIKLHAALTGKAAQTLEGAPAGGVMAFSRDGKTLAVADGGRVQLWDVGTGKVKGLGKYEGIQSAVWGKRGREIVTASLGRITHWSLEGKAERRLDHDAKSVALLSPCGRFALVSAGENADKKLIDTEKGQPREGFQLGREDGERAVFHPSGKLLAVISASENNKVQLYSTSTGKRTGTIQIAPEALTRVALVFSPDGRTLLTAHQMDNRLQRWELATGKARQAFRFPAGVRPSNPNPYLSDEALLGGLGRRMMLRQLMLQELREPAPAPEVVVSPNGKLVGVINGERVGLCDVATGKLARHLDGADGAISALAFSPDGKLAAAGGADHVVRLWEVASGKLVASLPGHRAGVNGVTFSPDNKHLLSWGGDQTALLWSVEEALRLPVAKGQATRQPRKIEELWDELAAEDAEAAELAGREMAALADAPAFLAKELRPAVAIDPARLKKLIELIDSEDRGQREAAAQELAAMDEQARPALEEALKSNSAEVRKRAANLLEKLDAPARGAARQGRAVEVLERVGGAAARKVLTELARGAPSARLTRDAAEALARLGE